MFYVYEHVRLDTNKVFYVGKGCKNRLHETRGRNVRWQRTVNKANGFIAATIADDLDEELAFLAEQERIDQLQRLGYRLANMTNGGEGLSGYKHTDANRQKISERMSRTMKAYADVLRAKQTGDNNSAKKPGVGLKISQALSGRTLTPERRMQSSQPRSKNPKAKVVYYQGKRFGCLADLAEFLNIKYRTLLSKIRYNTIELVYEANMDGVHYYAHNNQQD